MTRTPRSGSGQQFTSLGCKGKRILLTGGGAGSELLGQHSRGTSWYRRYSELTGRQGYRQLQEERLPVGKGASTTICKSLPLSNFY